MKTVGAFEAKTHLAKLLDEVERGEEIVITRHGKPVARLLAANAQVEDLSESISRIREIRSRTKSGPESIKELINEGRRF
jgi:prevent-host-death family protein